MKSRSQLFFWRGGSAWTIGRGWSICLLICVAFSLSFFDVLHEKAIDHVVNSAAKGHYMSGGQLKCSIVFRGPNGAAAGVGL